MLKGDLTNALAKKAMNSIHQVRRTQWLEVVNLKAKTVFLKYRIPQLEFYLNENFGIIWLYMMFVYESRMNYLGNINHQERLIKQTYKSQAFQWVSTTRQKLSTLFGRSFYCVRADLFIKAQNKNTNSIWENPRKQTSLKVVVWNKLSLIVTTQATISSIHQIFQE
ncbi:Hypothetical_protein [Hexamita inflata]|uniref:Hypothetical_protein n=1 Tax=Hexamita inflata TaxID=28002 RepID=A0AA86QD37_9EUKA|nr:Hypothetical protein HINF_LOCUS40283 [Hexamita inflata]